MQSLSLTFWTSTLPELLSWAVQGTQNPRQKSLPPNGRIMSAALIGANCGYFISIAAGAGRLDCLWAADTGTPYPASAHIAAGAK